MKTWIGIFLLSALSLAYFGLWGRVYVTTPEYRTAKAYIETSEDVRAILGDNATISGLPRGWILRSVGEAYFRLRARGTSGRRRLDLQVRRVGADWRVVDARYDGNFGANELAMADVDPNLQASGAFDAGHALFQRGRPAESIAQLDRALDLDSLNVEAWFWRAKAYQMLGEPAAAVSDLNRVLELHPGHQGARQSLDVLAERVAAPAGPDCRTADDPRCSPGPP